MADKEEREPAEGKETASGGTAVHDDTESSLSGRDSKNAVGTADRGKEIFLSLNEWQDNDESITEGIAEMNVSKESKGTRRKILPCLHLFTLFVNDKIPITSSNKDKPQVLIIHSDFDCKDAEELSTKLCEHKDCRVVTLSQIEPLLMMQPYDFKKAAFEWAHVIIVIVEESWLDDIQDSSISNEREQSSLDRKYEFTCMQNIFVRNASINFKLVLVTKDDEICNRQRINVELGSPININNVDKIAENVIALHLMTKHVEKKTESN